MDALVSWIASPEPNVTSYNVWRGYSSGNFFPTPVIVNAPTTQYQFTDLDDFKKHYFAVSAVNSVPLESALSAEVSKRLTHRLTLK